MKIEIKNKENIQKAMELLKQVYIEAENGDILDIKFFNFEAFNEKNFKKKIDKNTNIYTQSVTFREKYNQIFPTIDIKYCFEKKLEIKE